MDLPGGKRGMHAGHQPHGRGHRGGDEAAMRQANGGTARAEESLAVRILARVPGLADALVQMIEKENPAYRTMAVVPGDDLWRSCHDNLTRILQLIARRPADGGTAGSAQHYDAARVTGRRRAEQGMPLDDVLRSFRLGGRLVWEALIDQAHADHLADRDGLLDLATRVWEVIDATSAQVAGAWRSCGKGCCTAGRRTRPSPTRCRRSSACRWRVATRSWWPTPGRARTRRRGSGSSWPRGTSCRCGRCGPIRWSDCSRCVSRPWATRWACSGKPWPGRRASRWSRAA